MRPSCGRVNAGEAPIDLSTEGGLLEIWHDFWSSLLIAVAARRIAKKGQDAPDRDRPQLKQEIHSAASARCLNGSPNRCQTSTKASASVSIKPSS